MKVYFWNGHRFAECYSSMEFGGELLASLPKIEAAAADLDVRLANDSLTAIDRLDHLVLRLDAARCLALLCRAAIVREHELDAKVDADIAAA